MAHKLILFFFLALCGSQASCAFKKVIPEGEYLYTGASVRVSAPDSVHTKQLSADLTASLSPSVNRKILGIPWRLVIYNAFYNKKKDKLTFMKKTAEEPVLLDKLFVENMESVLEGTAFNDGFFTAQATSTIKKKKRRRKAKVLYQVEVAVPYRVKSIIYRSKKPKVGELLNSQRSKCVIPINKAYELEALRTERKRLAAFLKSEGYYFFEESMLEFTADTVFAEQGIELSLKVKKETPPEALRKYKIGAFTVFPDYQLSDAQSPRSKDSLQRGAFTYVFQEKVVKPYIIEKAVALKAGEYYNSAQHETTLKRLSNLNTFKFLSLRFEPEAGNDSLLNVRLLLTPKVKRTIEGELGGSIKPGLFFTPQAGINYTNRNLFGGSELLRISGSGEFNFPIDSSLSYFDKYQLAISLQKPGLLSPFKNLKFKGRAVGSTYLRLNITREGYNLNFASTAQRIRDELPEFSDFLNENPDFVPTFALLESTLTYGFNWSKQAHIRYEFNPIKFGYQRSNFREEDEELSDLILALSSLSGTPQIALSLEDMIYYQPEYIFTLDTRQRKLRRDNYLLRTRVAFAANRLLARNSVSLPAEAFQSPYFILEPDFRYLAVYKSKNQLALRFAPFVTFPFNREVILPFFDLYSIGGPASNRAFIPRTVGPGNRPTDQILEFPFTGLGNIKLETNAEYRYQISSLFELAAFVDAGNVWQFYQDPDPFETQFRFGTFYRQLAVGAGIGVRLDFEILLLRFDFAIPLTKPWLPEGERWVGDNIQLGKAAYRRENLQFNFAFGYPF